MTEEQVVKRRRRPVVKASTEQTASDGAGGGEPSGRTERSPSGAKHRARRRFRLAGRDYEPGDVVPASVMAGLPRPESLERAGFVTKE